MTASRRSVTNPFGAQSEYLIPRPCREWRTLHACNAYKVTVPVHIDPRAQWQKSPAYLKFLLSMAFQPDAQVTSPANPGSQPQLPALRALSHNSIFFSQALPRLQPCREGPSPLLQSWQSTEYQSVSPPLDFSRRLRKWEPWSQWLQIPQVGHGASWEHWSICSGRGSRAGSFSPDFQYPFLTYLE